MKCPRCNAEAERYLGYCYCEKCGAVWPGLLAYAVVIYALLLAAAVFYKTIIEG